MSMSQHNSQPKYHIYPSLLDAFTRYQQAGDTWEKYWGNSDTPSVSLDEFEERELQSLLDKINRVPQPPSLPADIGTVFNEIVDCIAQKQSSSPIIDRIDKISNGAETTHLVATIEHRVITYPVDMCRYFANLYPNSIPQLFVEGLIETHYGVVRLYGYLDELTPNTICDIKTTKEYKPWKYQDNAQHLVYPYCLGQMGYEGYNRFCYDIAAIKVKASSDEAEAEVLSYDYYREEYHYRPERDEQVLRERLEEFISFLEYHRERITHPRIFGQDE